MKLAHDLRVLLFVSGAFLFASRAWADSGAAASDSSTSKESSAPEPTPAVAPAPPSPEDHPAEPVSSPAHRHVGFYLRMDAGAGYMSCNFSGGGDTATDYGVAPTLGLAIGTSLSENLILAGRVYDSILPNPSWTTSWGKSGTYGDFQDMSIGLGPELTYYFMPSNIYVSAMLAVTRLTPSSDSGWHSASSIGWGLQVAAGKEWWIGQRWGLGGGARLSFQSNSNSANTGWTSVSTWNAGLALSASWN